MVDACGRGKLLLSWQPVSKEREIGRIQGPNITSKTCPQWPVTTGSHLLNSNLSWGPSLHYMSLWGDILFRTVICHLCSLKIHNTNYIQSTSKRPCSLNSSSTVKKSKSSDSFVNQSKLLSVGACKNQVTMSCISKTQWQNRQRVNIPTPHIGNRSRVMRAR